ncbi:MAG: hypothetical protein WC802_00955 [Patescibacteria group bacterium]
MGEVIRYAEGRGCNIPVKESPLWRVKSSGGFMISVEFDDEVPDQFIIDFSATNESRSELFDTDDDAISFSDVFNGREIDRRSFVDGLSAVWGSAPDSGELMEEIAEQIIAMYSEFELLPDPDSDSDDLTSTLVRMTYRTATGVVLTFEGCVSDGDYVVALEPR